MKLRNSLLLVLLLAPVQLGAAEPAGHDLDPLLRVRETRFTPASPPAFASQSDGDLFVTQGGSTTTVRVDRIFGSSTQVVHVIGRGVGSPSELTRLKTAVVAARVGVQRDCNVDVPGLVPPDVTDITWYGRSGRRNSFRVVTGPADRAGLPPCPAEVLPLLSVVIGYETGVLSDPSTEVLTNG